MELSEEKKHQKYKIIIFGEDEEKAVSKAVWSSLAGQDIEIINPENVNELENEAKDALLILLYLQDENDALCSLGKTLLENNAVLADLVAVTKIKDRDKHLKILLAGFDAIFDLDFTKSNDFKDILDNRIRKAHVRFSNLEQGAEYQRFKSALDSSSDACIVFDENRMLFYVSEHYKKAYPKGADKLLRGTPITQIYEMLAEEQGVAKNDPRYEPMKSFWETLDGEVEFPLGDGRIWRVEATPLPDNKGSIVVTSDITEYHNQRKLLKNQSDELKQALIEAQEANSLQEQFINMVSHEFRTPLTIIDGNVQIIQKRGSRLDKEDLEKRCQIIRSAISRLVYTMEGVLSSNMLSTGKYELSKERFNLKSLIIELCDEYKNLSKSIEIQCDIGGLPEEEVFLDKKIVTLILSNLLSNAVKFSKNKPNIDVIAFEEDDFLFIEVIDEGIGIPIDEQEKIFQRYYRASTSAGISGTGIGLHLVYDLSKLHGGSISVDSKPNKGTKFIVKIPLNEA
jgi:signal transduction histidine kinase